MKYPRRKVVAKTTHILILSVNVNAIIDNNEKKYVIIDTALKLNSSKIDVH